MKKTRKEKHHRPRSRPDHQAHRGAIAVGQKKPKSVKSTIATRPNEGSRPDDA